MFLEFSHVNIVDPLHVVAKVPFAREAVSWFGSLTGWEPAKVRVFSMSVQSMGFTFMTEQTGIRREHFLLAFWFWHLTSIWPQMGVQIFAGGVGLEWSRSLGIVDLRIDALLLGWLVVRAFVQLVVGTPIVPILVGPLFVAWIIPGLVALLRGV